MKNKKMIIRIMVAAVLLHIFAITGCKIDTQPDSGKVTKPHIATNESTEETEITEITEIETTTNDTTSIQTEASTSVQTPMNPITSEDFRTIAVQLGYTISDTNYTGSGVDELLSGMDHDYFYYIRYTLYASEELAKKGIQECYDNASEGEEGGVFVGELLFEVRTGYDIVVAKSTDENYPVYSVFIRVNDAIIDAFTFTVNEAGMKEIDDFIASFGYSVVE